MLWVKVTFRFNWQNASGGAPIVRTLDENTCSDGYDNDGDTLTDDADGDCATGREIPSYKVEAFKFGKGTYEYDFVLTGPVDDIIALENMAPSVTVEQPELTSFARSSFSFRYCLGWRGPAIC